MTALLSLSNIRAGYDESVVLHDLSLEVGEGEVVCLLGANGAGKTTTTRVIAGLLRPWSGAIQFAGRTIAEVPGHLRVGLGIGLAPEGRQVFPDMTVHENLLLGSYAPHARRARPQAMAQVLALFPRLHERLRQKAGLLSGGEQQMLAIARAVMSRPRLLMLDEPSLGLAPRIAMDVYTAVAETARAGISILLVEQNAEAALSVADRGYVLANGAVVASGPAAELRGSALVQAAFLGAPSPAPRAVTP
jgi:branched-chain amino acid transport system ATP-binding protein